MVAIVRLTLARFRLSLAELADMARAGLQKRSREHGDGPPVVAIFLLPADRQPGLRPFITSCNALDALPEERPAPGGARLYSRVKSYVCPSANVSRSVVGLPFLSFWNCAKALGSGPKLAATPANLPSGTNVAV